MINNRIRPTSNQTLFNMQREDYLYEKDYNDFKDNYFRQKL